MKKDNKTKKQGVVRRSVYFKDSINEAAEKKAAQKDWSVSKYISNLVLKDSKKKLSQLTAGGVNYDA